MVGPGPHPPSCSWDRHSTTQTQRPRDEKIFSEIPRQQTRRLSFLPRIHSHATLARKGKERHRPSNTVITEKPNAGKRTDITAMQATHIQAHTDLQTGRDTITHADNVYRWHPLKPTTSIHSAPAPIIRVASRDPGPQKYIRLGLALGGSRLEERGMAAAQGDCGPRQLPGTCTNASNAGWHAARGASPSS